MKRSTQSFCIFLFIVCLSLSTPFWSAAQNEQRLNFVVIMADDLGWTGLSGYGSDLHQTPNLDQLAHDALKFSNAYASASICTPTRAALMTGKAPARLNMTIWHEASQNPPQNRKLIPPVVEGNLSHDEVTLAEVLREGGYRTGHVGKWHLGQASHYPETQGFDYTFGGSFWGAPATFYFPYRGTWGSGDRAHPRYVPGINAADFRSDEYLTDRLTDEALRFIDSSADAPFFLYLSYYTVHTPIEGKPKTAETYEERIRPELNHQNAHYAAMHESLDENVGRVLKRIDDLGVSDRTVIIFTSDNGGFINNYQDQKVTSNDPLRSGKGSLYEGGIRVPLIIHVPGVTQPGSVSNEPIQTTDLYPTILELAGLEGNSEHNKNLDGVSIVPVFKNPDDRLRRDALYWHYPHYYQTTGPVSAIRRGNWKLLEFFEDDHIELYNLETDLGETTNLAPLQPPLADLLRRKLTEWRQTVNAAMPQTNPDF